MDTRLELLNLPDTPSMILKHAPLALVLCQVRYSSILSVTDPSFVAKFQRAIQEQYPLVTSAPIQQIGLQVGIVTGETNIQQGSPYLRWQFSDADDNWKVILTPDFLAIETRVYKNFNDFLDRLRKALDALFEYIQPASGIRLGLRYINEIRPGHTNWSEVIRSELLGPVASAVLMAQATQVTTIQQLQLRYSNNLGININHGVFPGGGIVRPRLGEEFANLPFYLLDFDVFSEFPPSKEVLDTALICQFMEEYHKNISRLFYWSITEEYLSALKG